MRIGQTSLRLTGLLAAGLRRRKLRSDLKVSRQVVGGETSYVVKIPETGTFLRFDEFEWQVLETFDGTRTNRDVWEELHRADEEAEISLEELEEFADSVSPALWEKTSAEKNLALLEKLRAERAERASGQNLFYMYFSAWDPNDFFDRVIPYLRWIWTPYFFAFTLGLMALGAVLFVSDLGRIVQDTADFYSFQGKGLRDFVDLWILLFFIGFIHESGHGLTCKHFGGEVHQMGFLLLYFTPAFYTDVTDIYLFDKDYKRLWTIFGGMWVHLLIAVLALIVWSFTLAGSALHDLAYKLVLVAGITGLLMNMNPLMKMDGYYALCQFLKIDNLFEDSFAYAKAWLRRKLLRQEVELPAVGRRRQRLFLGYAAASFAYSLLVVLVVLGWVKNILVSNFGGWGYLLLAGLAYLLLRGRLRKWAPALRQTLRNAKEKFMAWRMTMPHKAGAALALVVLFAPLTLERVPTEFLLEPGEWAEVRATVPGVVSEVRVHEGDSVQAGTVLAVLHNPELEARVAILKRELALAERSLLAARAQGNLGESQRFAQERQRLKGELDIAEGKGAGLVLRAPLAGIITTPRVEQQVGTYLDEGEEFALVADRRTLQARVLVRDWELEDVSENARVQLKLRSYPFRTFEGRVRQIMPAAAPDRPVTEPEKIERKGQELTNFFAVVLEFPNPDGVLREGMTGTAKIYGPRSSLAWRAARAAWRWGRRYIW